MRWRSAATFNTSIQHLSVGFPTHLLTAHTHTHTLVFKSTSGSVLSAEKQGAGIWALEADVRWPYSSLINEPLSHNTNFFIILEWLNSFPEGADGHDRAMDINEPDFSAAEHDAEQTNIKDKADIKILFLSELIVIVDVTVFWGGKSKNKITKTFRRHPF